MRPPWRGALLRLCAVAAVVAAQDIPQRWAATLGTDPPPTVRCAVPHPPSGTLLVFSDVPSPGGSGGGGAGVAVHALDTAAGTLRWSRAVGASRPYAPGEGPCDGVTLSADGALALLFAPGHCNATSQAGGLFAFELASGAARWNSTAAFLSPPRRSPPAHLYAPTANLCGSPGGPSLAVVRISDVGGVTVGSSAQQAARNPRSAWLPPPVGRWLLWTGAPAPGPNNYSLLDPVTGNRLWMAAVPGPPGVAAGVPGELAGSLVRIAVPPSSIGGSDGWRLEALAAANGSVLGAWPVPSGVDAGAGGDGAPPTVADGPRGAQLLLAPTEGAAAGSHLASVGAGTGALRWAWPAGGNASTPVRAAVSVALLPNLTGVAVVTRAADPALPPPPGGWTPSDDAVAAALAGDLWGVDLATGATVFSAPLPAGMVPARGAPPVAVTQGPWGAASLVLATPASYVGAHLEGAGDVRRLVVQWSVLRAGCVGPQPVVAADPRDGSPLLLCSGEDGGQAVLRALPLPPLESQTGSPAATPSMAPPPASPSPSPSGAPVAVDSASSTPALGASPTPTGTASRSGTRTASGTTTPTPTGTAEEESEAAPSPSPAPPPSPPPASLFSAAYGVLFGGVAVLGVGAAILARHVLGQRAAVLSPPSAGGAGGAQDDDDDDDEPGGGGWGAQPGWEARASKGGAAAAVMPPPPGHAGAPPLLAHGAQWLRPHAALTAAAPLQAGAARGGVYGDALDRPSRVSPLHAARPASSGSRRASRPPQGQL